MNHPGDEFLHIVAAANGDASEFEMRTFRQRDFGFKPGIGPGDIDHRQFEPAMFADMNAQALHPARYTVFGLKHAIDLPGFPGWHLHLVPLRQRGRIGSGQKRGIGIAPILVMVGGAGEGLRHATASYPSRSSSSASSGPPDLTIRPPARTCTTSGFT